MSTIHFTALCILTALLTATPSTAQVDRRPMRGHCARCERPDKKTAKPTPLLEGTMPNPPREGTIDAGLAEVADKLT